MLRGVVESKEQQWQVVKEGAKMRQRHERMKLRVERNSGESHG